MALPRLFQLLVALCVKVRCQVAVLVGDLFSTSECHAHECYGYSLGMQFILNVPWFIVL